MQCNDVRGPPAHPIPPVKDSSSGAPRVKREGGPGVAQLPLSSTRRTVCDHCRRRRIRCDGQFPCQQCTNATLQCKREHVPKKRGPKRGHGRVINELRAREKAAREPGSGYCSDVDTDRMSSAPMSTTVTASPSPQPYLTYGMNPSPPSDSRHFSEPTSPFTSEVFLPNSRSYFHLLPLCVDLYYEHIYPIMPLLYMPHIRAIISRPLSQRDKYLLYSLCALTSFHMSGRSLSAAPPAGAPSWEAVGRFFLDACVSARRYHDFIEEQSLAGVISSFWLSTSFFEISQSRKSWFYLREALTLALDLGLHDDNAAYVGLTPTETLCRLRVFWILFVTERSFAILRNKPLTLRKTPRLPSAGHDYEPPDIHAGFMKLVESYVPLDESFVNAWNDGSDPRVSNSTYLNLQKILAKPPDLGARTRRRSQPTHLLGPCKVEGDEYVQEPGPTDIQKADLLMTQQWLRLIVWQSSFRQGLLSTAASDKSMTFAFPLCIARDTASILQSLPSSAIEVHGMGMFEKIFEVGTWCVNVLGAYESRSSPSRLFSSAASSIAGMDFVGDEMGLLYQGGRSGAKTDPIEFFVKTLSLSPNSRTMFAEKLLLFAGETPGGMRTALSPALSSYTTSSSGNESVSWNGGGTVMGEVTDEGEVDEILGALKLHNVPFAGDTHAATKGVQAPSTHSSTIPTELTSAVFRTDAEINAGMGLGAGLTPSYNMPNNAGPGSFTASSDASTADWSNYAYSSGTLTAGHSGSTILISDTGVKSASFGAFTGSGDAGTIIQQRGYTDGKGGDDHRAMSARFPTGGILGV